MIYEALKSRLLRVVKAPTEPPDAPRGSHGSEQVFRASPKFLRYRLMFFSMFVLLLVLATFTFVGAALIGGVPYGALLAIPAWIALGTVLALIYFGIRIDYDMRYYIVTDRSLRVREGAWTIKEKTITYANVQNLRVTQGPIMRAFGFWSLKVDTAGGGATSEGQVGGGHEVNMAGIENAHEVRDIVLGYLRSYGGGSGLGDLDDPDDAGGRLGQGAPVTPRLLEALRDLRDEAAGLRSAAGGG